MPRTACKLASELARRQETQREKRKRKRQERDEKLKIKANTSEGRYV